jgi:hypothetical protein
MFRALHSRWTILAVSAIWAIGGALAFVLAPAASTTAAAVPAAPALKPGVPLVPNRPVIGAAGSSSQFAGYLDTPTGGLASASVTFKIPLVACTASTVNDLSADPGVLTRSLFTYALIEPLCTSTGPTYYYGFATPAGSFTEPGAAAGDIVVTSLFQSSTSTWAKIHDLTNGAFWFADDSTNVGDDTVGIGSYVPNSTPLVKFATTSMSNAQVNGDYLTFESPTQYNAVSATDTLVSSGALATTAGGTHFSLVWRHST